MAAYCNAAGQSNAPYVEVHGGGTVLFWTCGESGGGQDGDECITMVAVRGKGHFVVIATSGDCAAGMWTVGAGTEDVQRESLAAPTDWRVARLLATHVAYMRRDIANEAQHLSGRQQKTAGDVQNLFSKIVILRIRRPFPTRLLERKRAEP